MSAANHNHNNNNNNDDDDDDDDAASYYLQISKAHILNVNDSCCFRNGPLRVADPKIRGQQTTTDSWYLGTANLRTKILDFRGFDSSRINVERGGIPRPWRISQKA